MFFVGDFAGHVFSAQKIVGLLGVGLQFKDDPKILPGDDEILMFIGRFLMTKSLRHGAIFREVYVIRNIWYDSKSLSWHCDFTAPPKGFWCQLNMVVEAKELFLSSWKLGMD